MKKLILLGVMVALAGCNSSSGGGGSTCTDRSTGSEVTAPPSCLEANPFYKKFILALGIPILSSENVADLALIQSKDIVVHMLGSREDVVDEMLGNDIRIAIIADTEVTTDIPEHAFLKNDPDFDWDANTRGLGATLSVPVSSGAEENLLCAGLGSLPLDVYDGEDIFIHEFAHGIHLLGLNYVDTNFQSDLDASWTATKVTVWDNTYAGSNSIEFFAEGVQSFFNVDLPGPAGGDGTHNDIDTRLELLAADPVLYEIIDRFLPDDDLTPSCQ